MTLSTIIGIIGFIAITGFLLTYFAKQDQGQEHVILRLLLLLTLVMSTFLLGKAVLDTQTRCTTELANTTEDIEQNNATFTEYRYKNTCFQTTSNTQSTFMKVVARTMQLAGIYLFIYIIYKAWQYAGRTVR